MSSDEYIILFNKIKNNIKYIVGYFMQLKVLNKLKNNLFSDTVDENSINDIHILTYYMPSILWFNSTIQIIKNLKYDNFADYKLLQKLTKINKFIEKIKNESTDELNISNTQIISSSIIKNKCNKLLQQYMKYKCNDDEKARQNYQSALECSIILLMMFSYNIFPENTSDIIIFLNFISNTSFNDLNDTCKKIMVFLTNNDGNILFHKVSSSIFKPFDSPPPSPINVIEMENNIESDEAYAEEIYNK